MSMDKTKKEVSIVQILKLAAEKKASDVHLTANSPPVLRVDGSIFRVNSPQLSSEEVKNLCYSLISDEQKARFESEKYLDFSFFVKNLARFRGALFYQKASVAGVFRLLNYAPPDLDDLSLPPSIKEFIHYPHGLVLITGPTGSGKSTTLAACIGSINKLRRGHILTIEDPIEIIHQHNSCIVNQRELGVDCRSFGEALKSALRVDPDVCLVGEMRDKVTIEATLKLAETGHLVFSTLHTNTAPKSIDRILGVFDLSDREMIQNQLSTVLQAVVSQRLVPSEQGGRQVVTEILLVNPAVRNLIREGKIFQIYSVMQTNRELGMLTMNAHLVDLVSAGTVTLKEAFKVSAEKEELYQLFKKRKLVA